MVARCDYCDHEAKKIGSLTVCGYRYDPAKGSLRYLHCGRCKGPLRAKRKGETESNIVDASQGPPTRIRKVWA